jgi:PAS domain S-box-containing protein
MVAGIGMSVIALGLLAWTAVSGYLDVRTDAANLGTMMAAAVRGDLKDDPAAAARLEPFTAEPHLLGAAVYLADGTLLTKRPSDRPSLPAHIDAGLVPGTRNGVRALHHYVPILNGGQQNGMLLVEFDLTPMWKHVGRTGVVTLALLIVATVIAAMLHRRLHGTITETFGELRNLTNAIPTKSPFESRLHPAQDPELSGLVERLNGLFHELQARGSQLTEAKLDLELNVLTRTSELQQQIEDRKRAETALKESELRYRNLFENNPMPMFVIGLESLRFLAVNLAAMRHYGYSAKEFSGFTLSTLTHGTDSTHVDRAFRSEERTFDAGEWRHLRKDGDIIDVQLTAHTLMFGGKIAKIVLANDITERNRAQRALDEVNKKLVETSRQAGMAEVATGVLHNVGNVLNSVNVSASVLARSIENSKTLAVKKVAALLEANKDDMAAFFGPEGKGRTLTHYLATLVQELEAERTTHLRELDLLTHNITHIKEIVAMQQNYAKVPGMMETMSAQSLVEEALRLTGGDLAQDGVYVELSYITDLPPVVTDRHKALQIFVNLISNARQAMAGIDAAERQLFIEITASNTGGSRISIRDRGCGIAPENLTRIFNHGFTTKKDGHGFGLHGAANSAKELNGSVSVTSDGLGLGATFVVELPPAPNPAEMESALAEKS